MAVLLLIAMIALVIWGLLTGWFARCFHRPDHSSGRRFANVVLACFTAAVITVGVGFACIYAICSGIRV